jgi:hypothetical protein
VIENVPRAAPGRVVDRADDFARAVWPGADAPRLVRAEVGHEKLVLRVVDLVRVR